MSLKTIHDELISVVSSASGIHNVYGYELLVSEPESDARILHSDILHWYEVCPVDVSSEYYSSNRISHYYTFKIVGYHKITPTNQAEIQAIIDSVSQKILTHMSLNSLAEPGDVNDSEFSYVSTPTFEYGYKQIGSVYMLVVIITATYRADSIELKENTKPTV